MQKLITIGLRCASVAHETPTEHLGEWLAVGWRVQSVTPLGSTPANAGTLVWVAVVLELSEPTLVAEPSIGVSDN